MQIGSFSVNYSTQRNGWLGSEYVQIKRELPENVCLVHMSDQNTPLTRLWQFISLSDTWVTRTRIPYTCLMHNRNIFDRDGKHMHHTRVLIGTESVYLTRTWCLIRTRLPHMSLIIKLIHYMWNARTRVPYVCLTFRRLPCTCLSTCWSPPSSRGCRWRGPRWAGSLTTWREGEQSRE